jgi:hypothetical protein
MQTGPRSHAAKTCGVLVAPLCPPVGGGWWWEVFGDTGYDSICTVALIQMCKGWTAKAVMQGTEACRCGDTGQQYKVQVVKYVIHTACS